MEAPPSTVPGGRTGCAAESALLWFMVAAAFALGCQEVYDADLWWQVRSGQWIWANRQVPLSDPFTFTSADRPWIDLHWLFQVVLAAAFAAAGVRGTILLAAALGSVAVLVGLTARDRRWPAWVVAACWLPALLVMSARFAPRPEIVSLLFVAVYLAVLLRTDDNPRLAWILPPIQVLWANCHGLFVLGPLVLGAYLTDRLAALIWRPFAADTPARSGGVRWWAHVLGASVMVGAACMANPYGLRGTLFPLEIFPKITAWGGLYKSYIGEFMDLSGFMKQQGPAAKGDLYLRAEYLLLLALPLSFIVPAAWQAGRRPTVRTVEAGPWGSGCWVAGFAVAVGLILTSALGFPGPATPAWQVQAGRFSPIGIAALGTLGAGLLVRSSPVAALTAAVGGLALSAWTVWLRTLLLGPEPGPGTWLGWPVLTGTTVVLALATIVLTLRARARLFRMLLAAAFGYLALQAVRNINFFGLVAGFVLSWNLGQWAADLQAEAPIDRRRGKMMASALPVALAALVGIWIVAIATGRFYRATGEPRRPGLRESPLAYAHDAARFAGQPGLPDRALVYHLGLAGVYLFHNGPERKLFLDGRLEVPSREVFELYVRLARTLNEGRRGWTGAVRQLGDPLILLDHQQHSGAEASLLLDPDWRCIYYDALASVFVSRRRLGLEASYPTIDFAARHFGDAARRAAPPAELGLAEAEGLLALVSAIRNRAESSSRLTLALALLAGDRLRQAIDRDPTTADHWTGLGIGCWNLIADPTASFRADDPWDPARELPAAQAAFCFRRALELNRGEVMAHVTLLHVFESRGLKDAERIEAEAVRRAQAAEIDPVAAGTQADRVPAADGRDAEPLPVWNRESTEGLSQVIRARLQQGRADEAAQVFASAVSRGIVPDWSTCDQVAVTLLRLGRPAQARGIWERAAAPPSPAIQSARLATAALAALDFPMAERKYEDAVKLDPRLAEGWFGLAFLHTQRGERAEALAACKKALGLNLTPEQALFLKNLEAVIPGSEPGG